MFLYYFKIWHTSELNVYLFIYTLTAPPGPLTGCVIRLPGNQERNNFGHESRHYQHRSSTISVNTEDMDKATISCNLGYDGGIRPVIYSLEIYESNVLTTTFFGLAILKFDFISVITHEYPYNITFCTINKYIYL